MPRKRYGNAGAMCMGGDGGGLRSLFGRGGKGGGRVGYVWRDVRHCVFAVWMLGGKEGMGLLVKKIKCRLMMEQRMKNLA